MRRLAIAVIAAVLAVPALAGAQSQYLDFAQQPAVKATLLASSTTDVPTATTSEEILALYKIPAGMLSTNGDEIVLWWRTKGAATANARSIRVRLGGLAGTQLLLYSPGNNQQQEFSLRVVRSSATTQDIFSSGYPSGGAFMVTAPVAGSATLANDNDLVITGETGVVAGDATLLAYTVTLYRQTAIYSQAAPGGAFTTPLTSLAADNCATPPYSFQSDTTSGMCSSAVGVTAIRSAGSNGVWFGASGRTALGPSSGGPAADHLLYVYQIDNTTTGTDIGGGSYLTNTPVADSSANKYGWIGEVLTNGGFHHTGGHAGMFVKGQGNPAAGGIVDSMSAIRAEAKNMSGAGTIAELNVLDGFLYTGTAAVTTGYGVRLHSPLEVSGGVIGTYYHLYMDDSTVAGTNWAVYSAGTTPSYFGGVVGTGSGFKVGANAGVSGTVIVKGSDGNNCNLVFEGGILTSETCP